MAGVNSKVLQAVLPSGTHKFALLRRLDKLFEDHDMPEEFNLKINDSGKSIVVGIIDDGILEPNAFDAAPSILGDVAMEPVGRLPRNPLTSIQNYNGLLECDAISSSSSFERHSVLRIFF